MNEKFLTDFGRLVPPKDGGNKKPSVEYFSVFQEKKLALLDSANPNWHDEADTSEKWINKVRKVPISRSRLENIHSGRAFKYCSSHFGSRF